MHFAIVGAGPAGAALGYLLARAGGQVTLLERQTDFAREFRGEVLGEPPRAGRGRACRPARARRRACERINRAHLPEVRLVSP